jgi:hypothetical protein
MPLYTYLNLTTGKHEVHMRPIAERDTLRGYERIFEPCIPMPPPGGGPRLSLQAQQVLDGYKRLEERGQLRKTRSEASEIKDTWNRDTEAAAAAEEKAEANATED